MHARARAARRTAPRRRPRSCRPWRAVARSRRTIRPSRERAGSTRVRPPSEDADAWGQPVRPLVADVTAAALGRLDAGHVGERAVARDRVVHAGADVVDRVPDVAVAGQLVGVERRVDRLHESLGRRALGGVRVPVVDRVRVAAGLVLDDLPDALRVGLGDVDALLAQLLDGLLDPLLHVARGRAAGGRAAAHRAGEAAGAAASATTAAARVAAASTTAATAVAGVGLRGRRAVVLAGAGRGGLLLGGRCPLDLLARVRGERLAVGLGERGERGAGLLRALDLAERGGQRLLGALEVLVDVAGDLGADALGVLVELGLGGLRVAAEPG